MKKKGILPVDENMEARLKIENDWDYVKQWEQAIGEPSKAKPLLDYKEWVKIGVGLFTNITQLLQTQPEQDDEPIIQSEESGHAHVDKKVQSKRQDKRKLCSRCKGDGRCFGFNRADGKYFCRGTKECKYCLGQGTITEFGSIHKCAACNGSGICSFCKGSGVCSACHGAKYK